MLWCIEAGLDTDMEAKRFQAPRRPEKDGKELIYPVDQCRVTFEVWNE